MSPGGRHMLGRVSDASSLVFLWQKGGRMDSQPPYRQHSDENRTQVKLGRKLREVRQMAGYSSHQALADALHCDRSTVTKVETGKLVPSEKILQLWCEACRADAELYEPMARLARAAEESPLPAWYENFAVARGMAHTIRTWHSHIIPGSVQVPEYARALYEVMGNRDQDQIKELVSARIDLQQVFTRPTRPTRLVAVMSEAALRLPVGSDEVMRRQFAHLVEVGQLPHVGIQVVPASHRGTAGHIGAFTIASLPGAPDVLLSESAVRDVTSDDPDDLVLAHSLLDRIRWDALSQAQSREFIVGLADQIGRSGS